MLIKHFVLTDDGRIREYSSEEAFSVASGSGKLPELADLQVRYLQVRFDESQDDEGSMQVVTAGASLRFDADGRMCEADNLDIAYKEDSGSPITAFEQETCVQLALSNLDMPLQFAPPGEQLH